MQQPVLDLPPEARPPTAAWTTLTRDGLISVAAAVAIQSIYLISMDIPVFIHILLLWLTAFFMIELLPWTLVPAAVLAGTVYVAARFAPQGLIRISILTCVWILIGAMGHAFVGILGTIA